MGYWQDIFETYKSVHGAEASLKANAGSQATSSKKTPYMVVQIAFPLDKNTQLNDFESVQKLLENLLEKGFLPEAESDAQASSENDDN